MFTISLHEVKFFAPIGLYPQEKVLGNKFEVDIDVDIKDYSEHHFVDYTLINDCIRIAFHHAEEILEVLALKIYTSIKHQFPFAQRIKIVIRKYHPPMKGEVGYAQVVFEK